VGTRRSGDLLSEWWRSDEGAGHAGRRSRAPDVLRRQLDQHEQ